MNLKFFQYLFFLLSSVFLVAQEPIAVHLTENEGLPDIEFYSLIEDSEGFLWFACDKGLFRYDGEVFKQFSHPEKRGRSFFNLRLDSYGRVWCNNILGQFFYVKGNELVLFGDYKELKGQLVDFSFSENSILIKKPSANSILVIDLELKTLQKEIKNVSIQGIGNPVANETLFLNSDHNIVNYNQKLTEYTTHKHKVFSLYELKGKPFFTAYYSINDFIFIVTQEQGFKNIKLFCLHKKNHEIKAIKLPQQLISTRINHIVSVDNSMYFSTGKGVFITSLKDGELSITECFLKDFFITQVLKDKNDNIWVSSLKNGVWVLPNRKLKKYNALPNVEVLEKKNDSIVFLGRRSGELLTMNINTNLIDTYYIGNGSEIRALDYNEPEKHLFFSSDREMYTYNEETKKYKKFRNRPGLKSVSRVKNNQFLISAHNEAFLLSSKRKKVLVSKRSYKSHYSSKKQKNYVLDVEGLKVFDNASLKKEIIFKDKSINAFDIAETSDGTIWIATYDNCILGIKDDKVSIHLNIEKGLLSSSLNLIKADGKNLWIALNKGLQCYNTETGNFELLTHQDGIKSFNIKDIEIINNQLLFSNNIGVYGFDKTAVFKKIKAPKIYIKKIKIQGKEKEILSQYTLKEEFSNLEINFNSKNFQSVKHTIYEYKLSDDKNWISLKEGIDFVKFTKLPAGEFQFQLRAKNKHGKKYSEKIIIDFKVLAPFYKQEWFITICLLSVVGLIILYFDKKTKRLEKEQKKELEKERISKDLIFSQLENLRSQMNPHFIFNALNSIQDFIILNEKKLARQFLIKFSKLIRIYLEHSQVNEVALSEEINALKLYLELEKDRFNDDFQFNIFCSEDLIDRPITIPSLFIQPYIENALKHGLLHKVNDKKIAIIFSKEKENTMICTITDNGIGRKASSLINKKHYKNHTSFATSANQKRVDLLNLTGAKKINVVTIDLYDEQEQPSGTKVIINISL